MASGQLLFKIGAAQWSGTTLSQWIWSFISNPFLVSAIFLYAFTTLIWIYVLRVLPLSLAYPITALSYVIVPILSFLLLKEKISVSNLIGMALIISGIVVSNSQK
jgi:drug/metabolite transporter (DMT)-like permease